jgi:uncharacterized protein YndB with AHSA1/START domain
MSDQEKWGRFRREFDASIDDVWSMWTDPESSKRWYWPRGMSVPVAEMDVAVGGTGKIDMEMISPERTMSMWFTGVHKEVLRPTRLVCTETMCDEDGTILFPASMGMPDGHPDVSEVIVELTEADGWNRAFDKLAGIVGT